MLQFFKPTSRNSGSACSFSNDTEREGFYLSMVKQASWDAETKRGKFFSNKKNPEASVSAKLSLTEVGGFLNVLEKNKKLHSVHSTDKQTVIIDFSPYLKENVQIGFSLSVNKTAGEQKTSFLIGFNLDEGRVIREYCVAFLQRQFAVLDAVDTAYRAKGQEWKKNNPPAQTEPVAPVVPQEDESNLDNV